MDFFTIVPGPTAYKCNLCGTICQGSYGKRNHEATQKHQDKKTLHGLKRTLEHQLNMVKSYTAHAEETQKKILEIALKN